MKFWFYYKGILTEISFIRKRNFELKWSGDKSYSQMKYLASFLSTAIEELQFYTNVFGER